MSFKWFSPQKNVPRSQALFLSLENWLFGPDFQKRVTNFGFIKFVLLIPWYVNFQYLQNIYSLCLGTRFLGRERVSQGGNGSEDRFFFHEKDSLSAVVGKKDGCLTDCSGRQRREVRQSFWPETKERETFSRKRKQSDRTISLQGKRFLSRGMHFLSCEGFSERLVGQNYKMVKKLTYLQYDLGQSFKWNSS